MSNFLNYLVGGLAGVSVGLLGYDAITNNPPTPYEFQELERGTVKLKMIDGVCSGTVIKDPDWTDGVQDTILTAKHCVKKIGEVIKILIQNFNEEGRPTSVDTYEFVVTEMSTKSDLAILQAPENAKFEAATDEIRIYNGPAPLYGTDVWGCGFPLGYGEVIVEGTLGYLEFITTGWTASDIYQRAVMSMAPGMSGGGVFIEIDGQFYLYGTVTGGFQGTDYAMLMPNNEVNEFIAEVAAV